MKELYAFGTEGGIATIGANIYWATSAFTRYDLEPRFQELVLSLPVNHHFQRNGDRSDQRVYVAA